jgi:hypothetical protein
LPKGYFIFAGSSFGTIAWIIRSAAITGIK